MAIASGLPPTGRAERLQTQVGGVEAQRGRRPMPRAPPRPVPRRASRSREPARGSSAAASRRPFPLYLRSPGRRPGPGRSDAVSARLPQEATARVRAVTAATRPRQQPRLPGPSPGERLGPSPRGLARLAGGGRGG